MRQDMSDRAQIARGDFYTEAELRAVPSRRHAGRIVAPGADRSDPNSRPMTAARRRELEALVAVCGHCWEPGDERSQLGDDGMHPECAEAWAVERAARGAGNP